MRSLGALLLFLAVGGCATDGSATEAEPADRVTATVTATVTVTATATVTASPTPAERGPFPRGFPKRVPVADLPSPVKETYSSQGHSVAVAIAPGVWAPLSPRASLEDAATAGVRDGFCASIKAYERKYNPRRCRWQLLVTGRQPCRARR